MGMTTHLQLLPLLERGDAAGAVTAVVTQRMWNFLNASLLNNVAVQYN
jgi:hypothetical protein